MEKDFKYVTFKVDPTDHEMLQENAAKYRMDLSNYIRMVLFSHIERRKNKLPEEVEN